MLHSRARSGSDHARAGSFEEGGHRRCKTGMTGERKQTRGASSVSLASLSTSANIAVDSAFQHGTAAEVIVPDSRRISETRPASCAAVSCCLPDRRRARRGAAADSCESRSCGGAMAKCPHKRSSRSSDPGFTDREVEGRRLRAAAVRPAAVVHDVPDIAGSRRTSPAFSCIGLPFADPPGSRSAAPRGTGFRSPRPALIDTPWRAVVAAQVERPRTGIISNSR